MALESKKISLIIKSEHINMEKLKGLESYGNVQFYRKRAIS